MAESNSGGVSGDVSFPKPEAQPPNDPSPLPLGYATPQKLRQSEKVSAAVLGALLAIFVVGWFGAITFPNLYGPVPPAPRSLVGIIAFFMLAVFAIVASVVLWGRRPMRPSRWFLFGIMIGLGIAGLLEGACWSVM